MQNGKASGKVLERRPDGKFLGQARGAAAVIAMPRLAPTSSSLASFPSPVNFFSCPKFLVIVYGI